MPDILPTPALVYLAAVSIAALVATVYDKLAAQTGLRRVPEATLLLISALGGSAVMLTAMVLIRHKTRHIKFMAGIPLIMALQVVLVVIAWRYIYLR